MAGRERRRSRGHIEERLGRTTSYRAIVYAGDDPLTKKPRYLKETASTRAEAQKTLTRLQRQVDERRHPRTNVTVGQVIARWLEVAHHEDSTRERYEDLIRLYIAPVFGDTPVGKLDAELLERFYARLRTCRQLCNGRPKRGHECSPLAANTVRKIHFILRAALDRAIRWRYIGTNEAELAEPPAFERGEPDPPNAAEAAALLNEASRDPEWGLFLWLTMLTGSRRGEMCALRWTDLDLELGKAWIEWSNSKGTIKKTKTRQKRHIALDAYTVDLLRTHRKQYEERCAALGIPPARDAFVFSLSPDGSTPLMPASVTQRYRRLALRLGLRSTRLHALRHYSATELIASGVDVRTVAGRLGHGSGGATTLRVYAAWVDEADRRAADTIASIVPRPDPAARDPRSPYEHVAAELRNAIQRGELNSGDQLPTVTDLAAMYHVSVGTAQRAVSLLKAEGLIGVTRGRRALVSDSDGTRRSIPAD
ncbi:MAG: tyrosine-type recombinase/integrase [Carbonactinosporaceae bacterium]